jgi:6-phospho-beta-glucosidase
VKITLLGGGGFRTPLTVQALRGIASHIDLHEVVLHDVDAERLRTIRRVVDVSAGDTYVHVSATLDLDAALRGADYVLCAIRVGGLHARATDERVAIEVGLVGQETVGAGGLCLILRSVTVLGTIAEHVARVAPDAWFINFTNPVGSMCGALRDVLGDRVIGVCDTPSGLTRRIATVLQCDVNDLRFDYFGLNHLGWLRAAYDARGVDLLAPLLDDSERLLELEEVRLFGPEYVRRLRLVPNEYLTYYYFPERHLAAVSNAGYSRAEYLMNQQQGFYSAAAADPERSPAMWQAARAERDRSYLSDAHLDGASHSEDGGDGYAAVAAGVIASLATDSRLRAIVDVPNGTTLPFLPSSATVEVTCAIDARGARPCAVADVPEQQRELMLHVHAAEEAAVRAARRRSRTEAIEAFSAHPLIASPDVAARLLGAYLREQPELQAVFA